MQHSRHRIRSGSVEKASVQGGGGGEPAVAHVGVALSGGSAGVSGCAGEVGDVGDDGGERGGSGWPTGDPAGKSEVAGVETGGDEGASRPTEESSGESAGVESGIGDGGESIGGAWRVWSTGDSCSPSSESISRNSSTSHLRLAAF